MKIYKKKKLNYKNGYIVKGDKVVGIDNNIVAMFNRIERDYQRALFNEKHPALQEVEPEEFAFETERGDVYPTIEPLTPWLDEATERAIKIMDDIDAVAAANRMNEYFDKIQPVTNWIADNRVVSCDQGTQARFDLKYLGNPLEMTRGELVDIVVSINKTNE